MFSASSVIPPDNSAPVTPSVHMSYGQSWRSNVFTSIGGFGFNPQQQTLLAAHVPSIGSPTFLPGPLPNSAGISLPGVINGVTGYATSDVFSIGRCSVLAYQLFCVADGSIPLVPVLEFCSAWPGSSWTTGGGGGLGPGATFTGSVTSDVLTTTGTSGTIVPNQLLTAAGLNATTCIVDQISGTPGGDGTYDIGVGQTVVSETMTVGSATVTANISSGSAGPGVILAVTACSGTIHAGDTVTGSTVLASTKVLAYGTFGTTGVGGIGTYAVRVGTAQTVGSESMQSFGRSWQNQSTIITELTALLPNTHLYPKYNALSFKSVGYTQGDGGSSTRASKISDLGAMLGLYDAMNLHGAGLTGMHYYLGLPSAVSNATSFPDGYLGTYDFCRTHAPGQGGTWSGRCFATVPSYAWHFNGADNIHTGDYGTTRWGEWEGYVKKRVEIDGVAWTPLWRPITGGAITVAGQTVTIPWARPAGPDFADGTLAFQDNADDGVQDWPNQGFHVKRGGVDLTITNVQIVGGMSVKLVISETINGGDSLEVSYAYYGPGGTNPGDHSGVGGNLMMQGPPSVLYPNGHNSTPKFMDAWAWPFIETITA